MYSRDAISVAMASVSGTSLASLQWGTRTISNYNRTETIGEGTYG
jgi:hypothetical protein